MPLLKPTRASIAPASAGALRPRTAIEEYDLAQRGSTRRLVRGGTIMVLLLHSCYLAADLYNGPRSLPLMGIDAVALAVGIVAIPLTFTEWFDRHWHLLALAVCWSELGLTCAATVAVPHTVRMLITLVLYSCGSACLVPWSPWWQQAVNGWGVGALGIQVLLANTGVVPASDLWIAALVAAGVGQFATMVSEQHRQRMLHSARMLDEVRAHLEHEGDNRERLLGELGRAQEQLRVSEQRFELFMRRLPGPAFIRDTEGRYVFVNDMVMRFSRTRAEDWIGKRDGEIGSVPLSPAEVERIRESDRAILRDGTPVRLTEVIERPRPTHWLVHKFPIPGADGTPTLVGAISIDVTERVRAEEALRKSEEEFRSLVENASDIITLTDLSGKMLFHSPSLERVTGFRPDEVLGMNAFDFIHPDDIPTVAEGIQRAAAQPGVASPGRFRIRRKDGSWRTLETVGVLLSGEPPRLLVNARDITEREQFESELAQARDAALTASQLKSAFLANMSHEIRTPLHIILGYSEYIAQRLAEDGVADFQAQFEAMARAGRRLLWTIQQILDFSKIEVGAFDLSPAPLEVAPILETLAGELRVLAAARTLELSIRIEEDGVVVNFDEHCLTGALTNLIQNAIKFTEKGGVSVRLYRATCGELCIDVADTGIGIDPEYLPKLFEPFSQERSGFNRKFEGSGLGLALAHRYLELNGAALEVRSEKGAGTVFTIRFGVSVPSAAAA